MFATRTAIKALSVSQKMMMVSTMSTLASPTGGISRVAWMLGATALLVPVIAYAPAHSFDDLDCQSYVETILVKDLPPPAASSKKTTTTTTQEE